MSDLDLDTALNAEQRAAVTAPDGPILVIAAAGTGKTRTLTYRVAYLVDRGIDPRRILLLTFTNRAAGEMLDRARALVGNTVGDLWGGTFHHLANRMLRRHAEALGFRPNYTILDQEDARSLVRAAVTELGVKDRYFPKPDVLLSLIGYALSTETDLERHVRDRFGDHPVSVDAILDVARLYGRKKAGLNAMDFDDLLANGLRLFREHPAILERYQERFLHVLVDEYQDTNVIQAAWIDALAERRRNLLVVGDDFQSIYAWRGANFRNFLSFPERYPGTEVFMLETNYRSLPGILTVANACIAGNREQFQKTLRPVREGSEMPAVAGLRDGFAQARFVAETVNELRREGYRLDEMVVLYRAHYHAMELQLELGQSEVPFVITSGVRFFEQAHIKDVCCAVRLAEQPGDELAFARLLEQLPRVGKKTCASLWKKLGGRCDLTRPEVRRELQDLLPTAAREVWADIEPVFAEYRGDQLDQAPAEVLRRFVEAYYEAYAKAAFDNAARRIEDLQELMAFAGRFSSAPDFLTEVALQSNLDAEADVESSGPSLRLSTVHQAKGLEWKVVFILWLAEGMFPSHRALSEGSEDTEAEERRLFYVAATRAKDRLVLCVPRCRRSPDGSIRQYPPSRFVREIPEELLSFAETRML